MEPKGSTKELIETIPVKTKAARLRLLMPDILKRIHDGVSYEQIVKVLNEGSDLELSVPTLRSYLYRYRKSLKVKPESALLESVPTIANGNLQSSNPPISDDSSSNDAIVQSKTSLEEVLDAHNTGKLGDEYLNRKPSIFGKNKGKTK